MGKLARGNAELVCAKATRIIGGLGYAAATPDHARTTLLR